MKQAMRGFSLPEVLYIILLVIAIAAVASFATYTWQHNQVNSLSMKVNTLNAKISSLNNQVSTLTAQLNKACQPDQQTNTNPACANYTYKSPKGVSVLVFTPAKGAAVASPVAVVGEVPGNWSFEAEFSVQLKNSKGDIVAQAPAHLLGDWQTTNLVPFSVQLTFAGSQSGSGTLVLQKDNPSGLPQNEDSVSIPVRF